MEPVQQVSLNSRPSLYTPMLCGLSGVETLKQGYMCTNPKLTLLLYLVPAEQEWYWSLAQPLAFLICSPVRWE